ncbi:hypothetical protein PNEG_03558 [Pneumocystis murina B123]|uniref:Protein scd2/ral3 n=1 Tax=Pneumocystis murina (strain B123) TaxID=1069680 RepID=M7P2K9_PNEMU|nr:hypothetical protein PNEG_03558 [Pneumocystis murina B123]EMR08120.1 hypothetical protein PNEG_03558 [Pneumocystis murina B123]
MIRLRKTQKTTNLQNSTTSISSKSLISIEPPKNVIKALYDYVPQSSVELGFCKGDFFYLIGSENDENWYEAYNPATNAHGLVPVSYFQVLGRSEKNNLDKSSEKLNDEKNHSTQVPAKSRSLYGIVRYDFHAERPDELEAQAGEAIIVIAQSNHEWFVAKPIGRLGGPGLIPVSFIEIRDFSTGKVVTNVQELVNSMAIPRVEEWKKMTAEYKNNSISLGKFNFDEKPSSKNNTISDFKNDGSIGFSTKSLDNTKLISNPYHNNEQVCVVSARVIKHVYINEGYQYLVHAEMENLCYRSLCRYYEDFYNLQVMLLEEFPVEAGRTGKRRILPYMPVPLSYVDDEISQRRCIDLDAYLRDLCKLPSYIKQSSLVTYFFFLREGDIECNTLEAMIQTSYTESFGKASQNSKFSDFFLDGNNISSSSTCYKKSVSENQLSYSTSSLPMSLRSLGFNSDTKSAELKYDSDFSKLTQALQSSSISKNENIHTFSSQEVLKESKAQVNLNSSQHSFQYGGICSDSFYIKIKIFFADDLIAIRVPRQITFNQLMEKLQDRLGTIIKSLRCKEEINNHLFSIRCDDDLRDAINQNSKLVLYAE